MVKPEEVKSGSSKTIARSEAPKHNKQTAEKSTSELQRSREISPDIIAEEPSESTLSHAETDEDVKKPPSSSLESQGSNISPHDRDCPTEEDVKRVKKKLQNSLQEEQMIMGLQMQLLLQLEKLNTSIASAQSEDRLAKLGIQQAQVTRTLKRIKNQGAKKDEETITIQLRS